MKIKYALPLLLCMITGNSFGQKAYPKYHTIGFGVNILTNTEQVYAGGSYSYQYKSYKPFSGFYGGTLSYIVRENDRVSFIPEANAGLNLQVLRVLHFRGYLLAGMQVGGAKARPVWGLCGGTGYSLWRMEMTGSLGLMYFDDEPMFLFRFGLAYTFSKNKKLLPE